MAETPPDRTTISASAASGAGVGESDVSVTEARGAMRNGRTIWILVISTTLAAVVLLGYWLLHASHMATVTHPQARDMNRQDISTFNTPAGSARQAPPGAPSTGENSQ